MLGPPTDNGKIELELRLTSADELQVERLILSVGSPVPREHRAAGADPLLDDLTVEDDAAIAEPLVFTLELLDAVEIDGKGWQVDENSRSGWRIRTAPTESGR